MNYRQDDLFRFPGSNWTFSKNRHHFSRAKRREIESGGGLVALLLLLSKLFLSLSFSCNKRKFHFRYPMLGKSAPKKKEKGMMEQSPSHPILVPFFIFFLFVFIPPLKMWGSAIIDPPFLFFSLLQEVLLDSFRKLLILFWRRRRKRESRVPHQFISTLHAGSDQAGHWKKVLKAGAKWKVQKGCFP